MGGAVVRLWADRQDEFNVIGRFVGSEFMRLQFFSRCGAAVLLVGLISACSVGGGSSSVGGSSAAHRSSDCYANRSGCIYEGRYESDERAYAEEEAKRLNRAALQRLRRGR